MAYIGKSPVIGNFVKLDAITAVNGQAAYTMQNGGSNFTDYESVNQFLVSLNGTIQAPTDSFTVSGSTLTFASNLSTGDVIDFIMVFGNSLSAGTPTDATVSTAKIVDDAVTAAKINNDIISGSTELASEPADTDEFLVSDAGTLKRIDYSLIKGGGIENSQIWLITADQALSGSSSFSDITSNISESSVTGYARIGDAMTVSSGVFTFPTTGIWTVEGIFNIVGSDGYGQVKMQVTTNNSSYSDVALSAEETDNHEYGMFNLKAQIDVTDTSNVKVKFRQAGTIGGNALRGNSSYFRSGFIFTRIGDT